MIFSFDINDIGYNTEFYEKFIHLYNNDQLVALTNLILSTNLFHGNKDIELKVYNYVVSLVAGLKCNDEKTVNYIMLMLKQLFYDPEAI